MEQNTAMEIISLSQKYTLSIEEASVYFGIGQHKLSKIVNENRNADFVLWLGTRARIKRKLFEEYVDRCTAI